MNHEGRIEMNQDERDRLHWLKQVKDKKVTQKKAAERMEVSPRWVRKLVKRMKRKGDAVVVHGLRGRKSNRKLAEKTQREAIALVQREYADFGPTLASEYLGEKHGISVSKETLRKWMIAGGIWKAGRAKLVEVHGWRARRSCWGELVQWDTSEHDWLEGRGPKLYLIAMIDDATSRVYARFALHDSTEENMRTVWGYLDLYGRPEAFYTDKAGLFVTSPRKNDPEEREPRPPTQIGRALRQLGITWIGAHSPQAKGRIERFFGTAQDRLVRGMRDAGVCSLELANRYLKETFLPMWNRRFVVPAAKPTDAHRALEQHDLAAILSRIEERTVANNYTFRVDSESYQIDLQTVPVALRKAGVAVQFRLDGSIKVAFQNRLLDAALCQPGEELAEEPPTLAPRLAKRRVYKRGSDWNRNFDLKDSPSLSAILRAEKRAGRL
jgi:transposase